MRTTQNIKQQQKARTENRSFDLWPINIFYLGSIQAPVTDESEAGTLWGRLAGIKTVLWPFESVAKGCRNRGIHNLAGCGHKGFFWLVPQVRWSCLRPLQALSALPPLLGDLHEFWWHGVIKTFLILQTSFFEKTTFVICLFWSIICSINRVPGVDLSTVAMKPLISVYNVSVLLALE